MLGARQALMRLHLGELGEAAVVRLVAPDAKCRRVHGIDAGLHGKAVSRPSAAVDDDFVALPQVLHVLADIHDDAARVRASDVEPLGLASLVTGPDHVDRRAQRCPHVVVVDTCGHDVDEDLVIRQGRDVHYLLLEGSCWRSESLGSDQPGVHRARRSILEHHFGIGTKRVDISHCRTFSFRRARAQLPSSYGNQGYPPDTLRMSPCQKV